MALQEIFLHLNTFFKKPKKITKYYFTICLMGDIHFLSLL